MSDQSSPVTTPASSSPPIDTINKHLVGMRGETITILYPPHRPMSKAEALVLAAYLVVMADDGDGLWERTMAAVQSR